MKEFEGSLTGRPGDSTLRSDRSMSIDRHDLPRGAGGGETPPPSRLSPADAARIYDPILAVTRDANARSVFQMMRDAGIPLLPGLLPGAGRRQPPVVEHDPYSDTGEVEQMTKKWQTEMLTDAEKREEYFNEIFSTLYAYPDRAFGEIFSPYYGEGRKYDMFMRLIQQASVGKIPEGLNISPQEQLTLQIQLEKDFERYKKEKSVYGAIHDASRVLFYPSVDVKGYTDSVQQFDSLGGDVAFRTPGVNQMITIIENVIRETMARNNGYLPPEAISGKVDMDEIKDAEGNVTKIVKSVEKGLVEIKIKERFKEWMKSQAVYVRNKDGKVGQELKTLPKWEVEKIFSLARGMMLIDGRLISLMAESTQPEQTAQYASQFLQDIIQGWAGYQHLTGKYGLTRKDLGLLFFKDEKIQRVLGLSVWKPEEIMEVLKKYDKDPRSVLEDSKNPNALYYIMRENPLRAGDLWTYISWRLNPALKKEKEDAYELDTAEARRRAVESMIKDFMDNGIERMKARWEARGGIPIPADFLAGKAPEERAKEWKEQYFLEYQNWIGTGVRFEKLRTDLEEVKSREDAQRILSSVPRSEKEEKIQKSLKTAKDILERMAELQGYRLWTNSAHMRNRLRNSGVFKDFSGDQIDQALADLSLVEAVFLKDRENILDKGGTFKDASLSDYFDVIKRYRKDGTLDEEGTRMARKLAKAFQDAIASDYEANKELYFDEYIYKRNYRHGFVLWDGDVPKDEFNFSRLAPTGGFARRARDNEHQSKAAGKVLEFMSNVREMHKMEDVVKAIKEVHNEIALYDAAKADAAIMEIAQGVIKFFAERSTTKIPIYGLLEKMFDGKVSFAKMIHGKEAMAWSAPEIETFIDRLENMHLFKEEEIKKLRETVPASGFDFGLSVGVTLFEYLMYWLVTYIAEKSYKGKPN